MRGIARLTAFAPTVPAMAVASSDEPDLQFKPHDVRIHVDLRDRGREHGLSAHYRVGHRGRTQEQAWQACKD